MWWVLGGLLAWNGLLTLVLVSLAVRLTWLEDSMVKLINFSRRHTDILVNHADTFRGLLKSLGFVKPPPKPERHLKPVPPEGTH